MTSSPATPRLTPAAPGTSPRRLGRMLGWLEVGTGVLAIVGGLLLAGAPDGSLLAADPTALAGTPFADYRWPGLLLFGLVGLGFTATGLWQLRGGRGARPLSIAAGLGLVVFEVVEFAWLGFQPLEAVFAVVGGIVIVLALLSPAPER